MKIIIYGIGKIGIEFINDLLEVYKDIEIEALTDTYVRKLDRDIIADVPLIEPSCIKDYTYDYIVVTPEKFFDVIKELLLSLHIEEQKIKSIGEIERDFGKFYCNLCDNRVFAWKYIGEDWDIFHHKNIVGASKRRGGCPICDSWDRIRYVYYIVKKYTNLLDGRKHSVLHFAPEVILSEKIRNVCGEGYITADIEPGRADATADITNLEFDDSQFEYIICNHVMEHIGEEQKAFSELKRCLRQGGCLVLTVPICWEQATYEDEKIETEEDRIRYYGQKDHVRLYGNDIVERIEKFGFDVKLFRCNEVVEKECRKRFGFIDGDSVLLCKKSH